MQNTMAGMIMLTTSKSYNSIHPCHTKSLATFSPTSSPSLAARCSFQCKHTGRQPYGLISSCQTKAALTSGLTLWGYCRYSNLRRQQFSPTHTSTFQSLPIKSCPPLAQLSYWRLLLRSRKHTTPIPLALSPNPQSNPQKLLYKSILIISSNNFMVTIGTNWLLATEFKWMAYNCRLGNHYYTNKTASLLMHTQMHTNRSVLWPGAATSTSSYTVRYDNLQLALYRHQLMRST